MTRIALATALAAAHLDTDLAPLQQAFVGLGAQADIRAWDASDVDWAQYDAVLLRSTWDYTDRHSEFLLWCAQVGTLSRLLNPVDVVRWNSDKRYLADLAARGIAIVPSHFLAPGESADSLPAYAECVVKPAIGAGAKDTCRYRADERTHALAHVQRLLDAGRSVLAQPYLAEVDSQGETGLIYIEGRFSHAIRKGPLLPSGGEASDALFVPEEIAARIPAQEEHALAEQVLSQLPFPTPLYARIDVLPSAQGPRLLELELVEPSLFFHTAEGSAERLARATLARLSG